MIAALWLVAAAEAGEITLWHAWRGEERAALEQLLERWEADHPGVTVQPLAVPYEGLASKVEAAVPRGNGPDLFIFAHERVGDWVTQGVVRPLGPAAEAEGRYLAMTEAPLVVEGQRWGWPLSYKGLVLFWNPTLVEAPPATTDDIEALAARFPGGAEGPWAFAWETTSAYANAPWLHGYGGGVLDAAPSVGGGPGGGAPVGGEVRFDRPENVAALGLVQHLAQNVAPPEVSGSLLTQLYQDGRVAVVMNGPWFAGDLGAAPWRVAPVPVVSATGRRAAPYVTVEALFLARENPEARALAEWLAGPEAGAVRASVGGQLVAAQGVEIPAESPVAAMRAALAEGVPMATTPAFTRHWEPFALALRRLVRGDVDPASAAAEAQTHYEILSRPPPPEVPWGPYAGVGGLLAAALLFVSGRGLVKAAPAVRTHLSDYLWVAPATVAVGLLTVAPFLVGAGVALFEQVGADWRFVGVTQLLDILLGRDFGLSSPLSFWRTLFVTVFWTATNVVLHVGIGLGLALLLREPWVRMRGVFRALLILPWAVPNYITALAWKAMFHRQFGAVNALLVALGGEPQSWFGSFASAFSANLATNTWLGFPFMMVVTLGALQSVPRDLEEAAEVDGANAWQRFRHVTLPLLQPALLPAAVLGSVWTFNQFNVIYLVSGGEPDGSTEILISQAYRWAFTRGHRYGYAAAYGVLIFGVLLLQSWLGARITSRRERA